MKIEHIASKPDRAGRFLVRFEGGLTMRLYRQTVEDFGLYAGAELSDDRLKALKESAGQMSAKMRAVRIVTASSVSRRDLEKRLIQKGESENQAKAAVEWLEELHIVDDSQTARQIVSHCAARGYGVARAKQMLYEKKIPKELWSEALEDYPDQTEAIVRFLAAKLSDAPDQREIKRLTDALVRRGHSWSEIRKAMSQFTEDSSLFPEA